MMAVICFMVFLPFETDKQACSGAKKTGYRITPIFAEATVGNPYSYGRLTSFVFIDANQAYDLIHVGLMVSSRFNLLLALVLLHVALNDGVEHIVGRQAVLVGLVFAQCALESASGRC